MGCSQDPKIVNQHKTRKQYKEKCKTPEIQQVQKERIQGQETQ